VPDIRLVIADSQPLLCEGLSACLREEEGISVAAAVTDVAEALRSIERDDPDVVVVDAAIAAAEGGVLLRRLRLAEPAPAVVLLAGEHDRRQAVEALRHGATGFVLKVAPLRELVEAVRSAARGQMWISPPLLATLLAELREPAHADGSAKRVHQLTEREREVLALMVEGCGHAAIAQRLNLAVNTVRTHTRNIQTKLGVHSNIAAVSVALEEGLPV
jgi:DNA-binding NarL/FixJ family response regulator